MSTAEEDTIASKGVLKALTGNVAAAYGAKLARVGGVFFFPIGPADEVGETLAEFAASGELPNTLVVQMQNERGCSTAQTAMTELGIRTIFTTSSHGLLWAWPQIIKATLLRVTPLIVITTRSLSSSVKTDWEDFILCRDIGALMFFAENSQDIIDTLIQAYRVAEDKRVSLPAIVAYEGWDVSHGTSVCSIPDQESVDKFLPPPSLDAEKDLLAQDWYDIFQKRRESPLMRWETGMETQYLVHNAMENAKKVVQEAGQEYKALFGRDYVGLVEFYQCSDAEVVMITMGAMAGTARFVASILREQGEKVGVAKLRAYRPFPKEVLLQNLKRAKVIITVERDRQAALYNDTKAAYYGRNHCPHVMGRLVGLAGRDVSYADLMGIAREGFKVLESGKVKKELDWVPLKGVK